jgi:hypothetical protein
MTDPTNPKSYSIQLKVRQTTVEYGFVSVLVTEDLFDENGQLDSTKLCQAGLNASVNQPSMKWFIEEQTADMHPVQSVRDDEPVLAVDSDGVLLSESDKWDQTVGMEGDD